MIKDSIQNQVSKSKQTKLSTWMSTLSKTDQQEMQAALENEDYTSAIIYRAARENGYTGSQSTIERARH